MNIAVICARKNSIRIKNKNFLKINKEPLINFTIKSAIKSKLFKKIIINTDSENYRCSIKNSKIREYLRPKFLGESNIRVLDVLKEMIKTLKINLDDNIFILFPTCPLRNSDDIINAFKIYKKHKSLRQLISISEFLPSINVAFYLDKKNHLKNKFIKEYNMSPGNNNHEKYFYCNYAILIQKASKLIKYKKLVNQNSVPYLMPFDRSIDIDEPSQLRLIKKILKK